MKQNDFVGRQFRGETVGSELIVLHSFKVYVESPWCHHPGGEP